MTIAGVFIAATANTDADARAAAEQRAEYYRTLASELEREMLALQVSFYQERVAYEKRIEELERELSQETGKTEESDFQYVIENGAAVITGYVGLGREVMIPATLEQVPVVGISDRAFENQKTITSVTLPNGIRYVGWFAFSGCVKLQSVYLPSSLSVIEYGAFLNCPADMVVFCTAGSYAEQYAISYGLAVRNNG